jgi:hypothetical protein
MTEPAPQGPPGASPQPVGRSRRTLYLIATIVLAPIVASYVIYYFFPREARVNYGTLLPTAPAPAIDGTRTDGSPFRLEDLQGRWVLLGIGRGECAADCERILYATRQARTMQGKDQDRVVRAWLSAGDAVPSAILAQHPDLVVARVPATALDRMPGDAGPLYLIDPLGNLVLRYPVDPDIRGIANDLERLLKASRIG